MFFYNTTNTFLLSTRFSGFFWELSFFFRNCYDQLKNYEIQIEYDVF